MTHQYMEIKIQELDKRIEALEQGSITDRIEYGTDGNAYRLTITNGNELEQEPCEDAVSRTRLKEVFHRNVVCGEVYDELIDAQPPVTVQEKTGHWILVHPLQEDDGGSYMCDCCKCGHPYISPSWKFCPNCGAKMVEPQESEVAE